MIALVGLGAWGSRHAATLTRLVGPAGVIGVDCDASRRAAGARLGIATVPGVGDLPGDVRAAVVATPTATHADIGGALLEAGLHVLVEKPLAGTVEDARRLAKSAASRQRVLMVGHVFLYQAAHERLRALAATVGPLRRVVCERSTPGYVKADSGAWLELAPHELAAAIDLGALETELRAATFLPWSVTGFGHQDGASAVLETAGCTVEVRCSWLGAARARRVWVIGERGQVELVDDGRKQRVSYHPSASAAADPGWETVTGPPPLEQELRAFLRATRGGPPVRSDASLGVQVVELTEAVSG